MKLFILTLLLFITAGLIAACEDKRIVHKDLVIEEKTYKLPENTVGVRFIKKKGIYSDDKNIAYGEIIGKSVYNKCGKLSIGDTIVFKKHKAHKVKAGSEDIFIIKYADILIIIDRK